MPNLNEKEYIEFAISGFYNPSLLEQKKLIVVHLSIFIVLVITVILGIGFVIINNYYEKKKYSIKAIKFIETPKWVEEINQWNTQGVVEWDSCRKNSTVARVRYTHQVFDSKWSTRAIINHRLGESLGLSLYIVNTEQKIVYTVLMRRLYLEATKYNLWNNDNGCGKNGVPFDRNSPVCLEFPSNSIYSGLHLDAVFFDKSIPEMVKIKRNSRGHENSGVFDACICYIELQSPFDHAQWCTVSFWTNQKTAEWIYETSIIPWSNIGVALTPGKTLFRYKKLDRISSWFKEWLEIMYWRRLL